MILEVGVAVAMIAQSATVCFCVCVLLKHQETIAKATDRERRILEAQLALSLGKGETVPIALRDEAYDENLKGNSIVTDAVQVELDRMGTWQDDE